MIETLFSLKLPAGFLNNGTTYQSKGRWFKGNLVRFFQGNKQPIGGWVQRTLTGAAMSGTPNAAHSWTDNSGNNWLAIGTTNNLYVVSSGNIVYGIMPNVNGGLVPNDLDWCLTNFGGYLVATLRSVGGTLLTNNYIFTWTGNTGAIATAVTYSPVAPYSLVTTPERFLVALRGGDVGSPFTAPDKPA